MNIRDIPIAVLDLEMTGLNPSKDRVCEVAIVVSQHGQVIQEYQTLVRPDAPMSKGAFKVHRITPAMLKNAPSFAEVADEVRRVLDGTVVVAHNAPFDVGFLHREYEAIGQAFLPPVSIDTLLIARRLFSFKRNSLSAICHDIGVKIENAHRAMADARATFAVYLQMVEILDPDRTLILQELLDLVSALAPNSPLRLRQKRQLREAFDQRRTLFIEYVSSDSPLRGLVHREVGIWLLRIPYIQAWCYLREGERVFRLDRIRSVEPGGKPYEIPSFQARI